MAEYNRYVTCEQCGTEYFVGNHTCPQCGHERRIETPAERARRYRREAGVPDSHQQQTVTCDICGEKVGQAGLGSHRSRMHGIVGPNQKYYKPVGGKRGDWTVSLVNGKRQIAATVSDAVAKRIMGMLF